ncbi:hypothetical protein [Bradyrhizobium sp. WD16]|uniref:hypothetical protein n=1 Tax=Bradyrhizobium sp. WD16 TaxID=1521768 RepID=UPI0020A4B7F8|nr:hypothetical protein [Bradyrhizobium sp. WD16]UTD28479.1 hypothetical protein DB459_17820 [Bradyrhizobium sp. WD16]
MDLESRQLTNCHVAPDGGLISLGFVDGAGCPTSINFPLDQIGVLLMTLPALIEAALRARYRDASLRYTYPLKSWSFERSSDPATSIITLRTADGFGVCFSMAQELRSELGEALATVGELGEPPAAN